jgi:hypothetical protein
VGHRNIDIDYSVYSSNDHAQVLEIDFIAIGEMQDLTISNGSFYLTQIFLQNTKMRRLKILGYKLEMMIKTH